MIQKFVERFEESRENLRAQFKASRPGDYGDIVKAVIEVVTDPTDYGDFNPDPERITRIDHGDYQGTLLFIIAAKGYQPYEFWGVTVGYGSCSGCDTLQGIYDGWDNEGVSDEAADEYLTLALHIVQGLFKLGERE